MHPIGNIDASAFPVDQEFANNIRQSIENRYEDLTAPCLKLWHFNDGGESRVGSGKSVLFTFHETSLPTATERNIAAVHDAVCVSSTYTKNNFAAENFHFVPLGVDPDFRVLANPKKLIGRTHWGLVGKWEHRKHTKAIIKAWLAKYGGNDKHHLSCLVFNPFFNEQTMKGEILDAMGGKQYHNIQFLDRMPQNAMMNDFINSIDIDLSGLSGAEGWGLCAFNATALGKWSIVLNATSHKDWANEDNSILVEPNGTAPLVDGVFFREGAHFNQGAFYTWDAADVANAFEKAEKAASSVNSNGLLLQRTHTWSNTVDKLIEILKPSSDDFDDFTKERGVAYQ